jgi:hypothetical protein
MHTPTIDVSQDQPPLPNQYFSPWLRGQTALFISQISAILGFVLFLASLVYYVLHLGEPGKFLGPKTVKLIVDYAHVVFMAVFILVLIQVLDDNERGSYRVKLVHERVFGKHGGDYEGDLDRSKVQLKMFKRRFLWFWVGMLFLYVFFTCQHSYELMTSKPAGQTIHRVELSFSNMNKSSDGKEEHLKADLSYEAKDTAETSNSTAGQKTQALNGWPHQPRSARNWLSLLSSFSLITSPCCSSFGVSLFCTYLQVRWNRGTIRIGMSPFSSLAF